MLRSCLLSGRKVLPNCVPSRNFYKQTTTFGSNDNTNRAASNDSLQKNISSLEVNGWQLSPKEDSLTKQYKFKNFNQAFMFMTSIAMMSERKQHHPEWSNVYSTVNITWTSHDAKTITDRDIRMAQFCDKTKNIIIST